MREHNNPPRRSAGNVLLAAGLLIILGVAAYFGWSQVQAARMRTALAQNPPPTVSATALPATIPPTDAPSPELPTATATAIPPATEPPAPTPVPTDPPTSVPASPTPQPAAVAPQPAAPVAPAPVAAQPGSPVRLVFPDLKIDAKVVPMGWEVVQTAAGPRSEWLIPKNEAGHHINSALLGQNDNLVISGHNNIYGMVFKPISLAWDNDTRVQVDSYTDRSEILNGRIISLYDAAGQSYQYAVTEFLRLKDTGVPVEQRLANARFMQPTGEAQLTIITCWPPTNNTHRLIVIAKPVQ